MSRRPLADDPLRCGWRTLAAWCITKLSAPIAPTWEELHTELVARVGPLGAASVPSTRTLRRHVAALRNELARMGQNRDTGSRPASS